MKLQDQVCTLEQANRLKELGIEQSSIWMWVFPANERMISSNKGLHYHELAKEIIEGNEGNEFDHESVAAFTVAELGVMLPAGCISCYNDHHGFWVCEFIEHWDKDEEPDATPYAVPGWKLTASIGDDDEPQTEAECRAAMLIYLLENSLTTPEECNKLLTT